MAVGYRPRAVQVETTLTNRKMGKPKNAAATGVDADRIAQPPKEQKKPKDIPAMPDGVGPHDPVTFGFLLKAGLIKKLPE